jgi:CDP-4-dehydro-6-deoxyglucose reductase
MENKYKCKIGEDILDIRSDQTILEVSFSKKNLSIPFNCKVGICGACKCKILKGITKTLSEETGLTKNEINSGYILTCVRFALSDIEIENIHGNVIQKIYTLPAKISEINYLNDKVISARLRMPPGSDFQYYPGQYLNLTNHEGIKRSYSISNAKNENNELTFFIKKIYDGQMSKYFFEKAKVNDRLTINGPYGNFYLKNNYQNKRIIFLATGTGIAPVKAMIEEILANSDRYNNNEIMVYWGVKNSSEVFWRPNDQKSNIKFMTVFSEVFGNNNKKEYIQDICLGQIKNMDNTVIFAAGSTQMIEDAYLKFRKQGINNDCYSSDAFVATSRY